MKSTQIASSHAFFPQGKTIWLQQFPIYHHLSARSQGAHKWCWAQSQCCWPRDAPRYHRSRGGSGGVSGFFLLHLFLEKMGNLKYLKCCSMGFRIWRYVICAILCCRAGKMDMEYGIIVGCWFVCRAPSTDNWGVLNDHVCWDQVWETKGSWI